MGNVKRACGRVVKEYYWCYTCGLRAKFHESGTASGSEQEGCSEKRHDVVARAVIELEED